MTLTYKVTRQGYAVGCYLIALPDPENARNKKKHLRSSMYTTRETLKSDVFFHFWLVGCQDDVIRRHMTSSNVTLTLPSHACHIFRKVTKGFSDILIFQMTAIKNLRLGVKFYPHIPYEC